MSNRTAVEKNLPYFLAIVQIRSDAWFASIGSKLQTRKYTFTGNDKSKFYRVVAVDGWRAKETDEFSYGDGGSAYCFVALEDGKNATLGSYKSGDIFYPAGFKGPAKGVRGNVFSVGFGSEALSPTSYNIRPLR